MIAQNKLGYLLAREGGIGVWGWLSTVKKKVQKKHVMIQNHHLELEFE